MERVKNGLIYVFSFVIVTGGLFWLEHALELNKGHF